MGTDGRLYTDVPNEILSQIASYLPFNDLNSLKQASKTFYSKIDLPKQKVDLHINFDTIEQKRMNFVVWMKPRNDVGDDRRLWKAKLCIENTNTERRKPYTDKEKSEQIAEFYYSKRGKEDNCLEDTFALGHIEGLILHLQFVLTHLQVDKLKVGYWAHLNDEHVVTITEKLKENQKNVDNLLIYQDVSKNIVDLIMSCEPKHLKIRCKGDIPAGFCHLPVIRKLQSFVIDAPRTVDIDVFSLEATVLDITSRSHLQIDDALKYLIEWIEKKRDIQYFSFQRDLNGNRNELARILSVINKKLATVSNIEHSDGWLGTLSLQITRISDDATLSLFNDINTFTLSLLEL